MQRAESLPVTLFSFDRPGVSRNTPWTDDLLYQLGQDSCAGEFGGQFRDLTSDGEGLSLRPLYLGDEAVGFAMAGRGPEMLVAEAVEDLREVAGPRAQVEDGGADIEYVVDLARVDKADEGVSHNDDLEVASGERSSEVRQRLVGQAKDILRLVRDQKLLNFAEFAAATNEAKEDAGVAREPPGGVEQGVERMTWAVVAGVHHDELAVHAVGLAKALPPGGIVVDVDVESPRRQDGDAVAGHAFAGDAVGHESVQGDDAVGMAEAEARESLEDAGGERTGLEPPRGEGFIRVEVHHPINETRSAAAGEQGAEDRNQGGRGEGDDDVETAEEGQAEGASRQEGGEVNSAAPLGGFAEGGGADADDVDSPPRLASGKAFLRVVVGGAAGEDGDLVTSLHKSEGQIGEILRGGSNIRIKSLV